MNPDEPPASEHSELEFHYIKSNLFRSVHCDGVFGGVSSDGRIQLTAYSERAAIPQKVVMEVIDGKLQDEVVEKREGKSGFIRDVEVNLVLGFDTVIGLVSWLQECLDDAAAKNLIAKVETDDNQTES